MKTVVPGIYVSEQQYTLNSLQMRSDCIAAFAGISERGPLNRPVHIKSFDAFLKEFGGFDTVGVLPLSVYNFFKNGGSECVIVRVANTQEATRSRLTFGTKNADIVFEAINEGKWGNYLSCRVWHEAEPLESVKSADYESGKWIEIAECVIEKNDGITLSFLGRQINRIVSAVEKDRVYFSEPIKLLKNAAQCSEKIKAEKLFVSFAFSCKERRETHVHLSLNPDSQRYYVEFINERSALCSVVSSVRGIPSPVFQKQATGGNDGIAHMSAGDFIGYYKGPKDYAGIGCFESRDDISLIAVPDVSWLFSGAGEVREQKLTEVFAVQSALITQAELFPGRFTVLDVPSGMKALEAAQWAKKIDSAHAAAYYPSIDFINPLDSVGAGTMRIPPSGAVCGCIASTDASRGVFCAPANMLINGAVGVAERITDAEYEFLYCDGVNLLKYFPGKGIKVWGARTLSSNSDWRYINVRRTFSRIAESIKKGTQWAVFEPNDKTLRKRLVRQVSGFLLDLWMKGYLAGSTSEQSFYVRCDEELNPVENINEGILTFEVGVAIVKPVEFFSITITAEKDGASVYIAGE